MAAWLPKFIQRFPVAAADIDELGHVNNIVHLRYAQDIAIAHWRSRAPAEMLDANVGGGAPRGRLSRAVRTGR